MQKEAKLAEMEAEEARLRTEIQSAIEAAGITVDDDAPEVRRWFCGLFARRRARARAPARRAAPTKTASSTASGAQSSKTETAVERAVFGTRKKQTSAEAAASRLTAAALSVEQHATSLGERASAARERARELMAVGKRGEAVLALKRSKALEKQCESATATRTALEQQLDVLESSALQKEVAQALSASVASTKARTKGLLGRTETAVEDAQELKDFSEDIQQVLTSMQSDDLDEDDLAAELAEMVHEHEEQVRETAPTTMPAVQPKADPVVRSFPKVPQTGRRYARLDEIEEEGVDVGMGMGMGMGR